MKYHALFLLSLSAFLMPAFALADAPTVASFTAGPTAVSYGMGSMLSWNTAGGSAPDFYIECAPGVSVKKDGSILPCNVTTGLSSNLIDNVYVSFVNLAGAPQTVSFRLIPKDTNGIAYPSLSRTVSVNVSPVPQPITDFTTSSSSPASGSDVVLSWKGLETPGVNLQFDCATDLRIFTNASDPSTELRCGAPAFLTDLSQSGSQTVDFVNNAIFENSVTVHVLPSIVAGSYDASHSLSLTMGVKIKPPAPAGPAVTDFSTATPNPNSGDTVQVSWKSTSTDGVNIQFSCPAGITVMSATSTLPCNAPAFGSALSASGSAGVSFVNAGIGRQVVTATLMPLINGVYDATKSKSLQFMVQVPGASANASVPAQTPAVPSVSSVGTGAAGQIKAVHTVTFTQLMLKGSRASQVSALQQFLAQDASLYPEGLVTGYFGVGSDAAIKRFQVRYGIAKAGEAGYGTTGPKTRAKLNSLTYF